MRCRERNRATGLMWRLLLALWVMLLPLFSGCAQGDLEQLIIDIKNFYLKGGFTNLSEQAAPFETLTPDALEMSSGDAGTDPALAGPGEPPSGSAVP